MIPASSTISASASKDEPLIRQNPSSKMIEAAMLAYVDG